MFILSAEGQCILAKHEFAAPDLTRDECPRQGQSSGPICWIETIDPGQPALKGLERCSKVDVLYCMHRTRRDLILQSPNADGETTGTFALRSPARPNPIATSLCDLVSAEEGAILVRGLDDVDGTPLPDIKPMPESSGSIRKPGLPVCGQHLRMSFEALVWPRSISAKARAPSASGRSSNQPSRPSHPFSRASTVCVKSRGV